MIIEQPRLIAVLDVFRTYAVMSVVCLHFLLLIQGKMPSFIWTGLTGLVSYGVGVFFIISGYVLSYSYDNLILKMPDFRQRLSYFWWRRFLRIYPAYLCALLILWAAQGSDDVQDLVVHMLNIHNFFAAYHRSINGVFWSLAVEFQWYIFAPFIIHIVFYKHWSAYTSVFIITGLLSVLVQNYATYLYITSELSAGQFLQWHNDQLAVHLFSFVLGVIAYRLRLYESNYPAMPLFIMLYMLSLAYILLYQEQNIKLCPVGIFIQSNLYYVMQIMLVLVLYKYRNVRFTFSGIRGKLVQFLAKISYGLYIWHFPVLYYVNDFGMPLVLFFVVYLLLSIGVASLSYYGVEQWFLKRRSVISV